MRRYFNLFWILVFVIGAAIPLFHINTSEITEQENRTLAKFPKIKNDGKINTNYSKEFESWLGDRFWGRNQLINVRFQTLYKINGRIENEKAFIGDDGWMFEKWKTVNLPSIKKQRERIEKDAQILERFAGKFKGKNIPIYLVLIPEREVLYQKYWERYYKPKPHLDYGDEMTRLLKDTPITVINSNKEMLEAMETEEVFYKDDMHLTSFGIHILLDKVYTSLKEKELDDRIKPAKTNKRKERKHVAGIAARLGLPGRVEIEENIYSMWFPGFKYHELEKRRSVKVKNDLFGSENIVYRKGVGENAPLNKTLISMGPCYSENIFELLRPLFSSSIWIRINLRVVYGETVKEYTIKEIQKLFDLKAGAGIIVITQTDFEYIQEALK